MKAKGYYWITTRGGNAIPIESMRLLLRMCAQALKDKHHAW